MTASNTVSIVDQTRQDFQYSSSVDGLLKQVYIPALNNVTFHSTPLMQMFGDFGGVIDFVGNKIIKAFKHQGAGGFGGISEGGDWVKGRNQKGFQGFEKIKYLNAYVSLTGPAARTVKSGEGSYVDAISSAMDDTLRLAQMQMERIIGGDGGGGMATLTSTSTDTIEGDASADWMDTDGGDANTTETMITLAGGGGYSKAQWFQPGMRVNLLKDEDYGANYTAGDLVGPFMVGSVNYDDGKISLQNVSGADITMASDTYYIVLEKAYGEYETAGDPNGGSVCLEPNGLQNLVDDGTNYSTIWGLNRTTAAYQRALQSKFVAAAGAELDEELMMGWVLDMANIRQSVPQVCVVDPKARLKYFSNRKDDRRFDMPVLNTTFGFQSIGVTIDNYTLILQSLSSLVPGSLYLLNVGDFKFAKATGGFEWVTDGPMGAFRQKEGSDNLYATAVNYMNLVCENPMGQLKVTGLATT